MYLEDQYYLRYRPWYLPTWCRKVRWRQVGISDIKLYYEHVGTRLSGSGKTTFTKSPTDCCTSQH